LPTSAPSSAGVAGAALFGGLAAAWRRRDLIAQLVRREVLGRYRGSMLGLAWSLVHPMVMLAIYTFVFSFVFRTRWPGGWGESKLDFALILFCGMIVFNVFSVCFTRAPGIIVAQPNFVKKVVFPLEVLPVVTVLAALFHAATSFAVLLALMLAVRGLPPATALLAPLVLAPYLLFCLGLAWFLAALGVYLRDVGQVAQVLVTGLMFLSPLFYPLSVIPEVFQPVLLLNPVAYPIEELRAVVLFGREPSLRALGVYSACGLAAMWVGYAFFQRVRRGFADVI
jgi:lipopolysaccharide transport system permease protein